MHKKHEVLIGALVFIIVFLGLALWYAFATQHPATTPVAVTATTTTTTVPTTPVTPTPTAAHLAEHAAYYDIDMQYPGGNVLGANASPEASTAAAAAMKNYAATTSAQFISEGNFAHLTHDDVQMMGLDQRKEALSSTYDIYSGAHTVSYVFTIYEDTLGAHPNTFFKTFTFDTATGAAVSIQDLFLPGTNVALLLSTRTRADLPGIIKAKTGYDADADMLRDGTTADLANFQDFYLTGTTLTLLFPPYQVAAYAAGDQVDPIALSTLSASIKPQFTK